MLKGKVEADETVVLESFKARRGSLAARQGGVRVDAALSAHALATAAVGAAREGASIPRAPSFATGAKADALLRG
jgi:hypothetical protein